MEKSIKKFLIGVGIVFGVLTVGLVVLAFILEGGASKRAEDFKNKAIQTEAKTLLISVYTQMKVHQIENDEYSTKAFYDYLETLNEEPEAMSRYQLIINDNGKTPNGTEACPHCLVTPDSFTIGALFIIDKNNTIDLWTINDKKELVHTFDGFTD